MKILFLLFLFNSVIFCSPVQLLNNVKRENIDNYLKKIIEKRISLTKSISAMMGFKASFKWSASALFTSAEITAEISGSVSTTRQTTEGEDYTFKIKENTACAPMRIYINYLIR
jgi:hypothetical protein